MTNTIAPDLGSEEPFVWAPERTGDYEVDCRTGRALAERLIERMAREGSYNLLGAWYLHVRKADRFEGPEVGFLTQIAVAAAPYRGESGASDAIAAQ